MQTVLTFDLRGLQSEANRSRFEGFLRDLGFLRVAEVTTTWVHLTTTLSLENVLNEVVDAAEDANVDLGGIALFRGDARIMRQDPNVTFRAMRLFAANPKPTGILATLLAIPKIRTRI